YTENNPVMFDDSSGNATNPLTKVINGALYVATFVVIQVYRSGKYVKETVIKWVKKGKVKTKLPNTKFTTMKLQHEFKHAKDFGVTGNWNKTTGEAYQRAIQSHINTATGIFKSKYRGQDVYVYINKKTGVGAYTDLSGNYIGGWKFSADQMKFHLTKGTKIK
ncbi:MAG TPA: hypothetical protein GXX18_09995, partial [Bacillales bacterium]|nr:hypothetical protein [Bacillales bacterium]